MVNYKINNLKIYSPSISKTLREGRYDTEDISEIERMFVAKHSKKHRESRTDLVQGDIVVVLEGAHTGKKVVFIKQLGGFKALVSGISTLNGVSAFRIDEGYLFKLSSRIEILASISLNADSVYESKMNESEKMDVEPSSDEKALEKTLLASVAKVPYMKSYLSEPFKVSNDVEFYSQEY